MRLFGAREAVISRKSPSDNGVKATVGLLLYSEGQDRDHQFSSDRAGPTSRRRFASRLNPTRALDLYFNGSGSSLVQPRRFWLKFKFVTVPAKNEVFGNFSFCSCPEAGHGNDKV
jgi:hypothetical protein